MIPASILSSSHAGNVWMQNFVACNIFYSAPGLQPIVLLCAHSGNAQLPLQDFMTWVGQCACSALGTLAQMETLRKQGQRSNKPAITEIAATSSARLYLRYHKFMHQSVCTKVHWRLPDDAQWWKKLSWTITLSTNKRQCSLDDRGRRTPGNHMTGTTPKPAHLAQTAPHEHALKRSRAHILSGQQPAEGSRVAQR